MNLLNYTQKLSQKIKFYDKYVKNTNFKSAGNNPFINKDNNCFTVIWIQEKDKKL